MKLWRSKKPNQVILIHSMGKVGSAAIYRAVKAAKEMDVLHTHQLNAETLDYFVTNVDPNAGHAKAALRFLKSLPDYDEVKIITSVREPVARNVSAFFENIRNYGFRPPYEAIEATSLINAFVGRYNHQIATNWFDIQVKKPLGIDVFKGRFDFEELCQRTASKPYDMLILRAEDDNEIKASRIAEFLDIDEIQLSSANTGADKEHGNAYSLFKQTFKPPREFVKRSYETDLARHFYTQAELTRFQNSWTT